MKEQFYHIYERRLQAHGNAWFPVSKPLATVCLVAADDGTKVARGVSICSDSESFSRAEGCKLARRRARRAFYSGKNCAQHDDPVVIRDDFPAALERWELLCTDPEAGVRSNMITLEMATRLPTQDWRQKSCAMPHLTKFEQDLLSWERRPRTGQGNAPEPT